MKKPFFYLIILATVFAACDSLWYYRSIHEFEQLTWIKGDTVVFEKEVDAARNVSLDLMFRYVQGFPYKEVGMYFEMTGPDGTMETRDIIVPVIRDNGEYIGEPGLDIWDLDYELNPNLSLKPGKYTMKFAHRMAKEELPLVMELGVRMEKVE